MHCDEDCRTAVFGKTERTVGWEGNGEPVMIGLVRHCTMGNLQRTDRSCLPPLNHSFTLDAIVHCSSLRDAQRLQEVLERRFKECGLELHPGKSKIVCCKAHRPGIDYPVSKFEFLGYEFRLRTAVNRQGRKFVRFMPAISPSSAKAIRKEIRGWRVQNRSDKSIDDLSRMFSNKLRGWINYFGHFYKSALYPTFYNLNRKLVKWATRKFKKLRRRQRRAHYWLGAVAKRQPNLFPHWQLLGLRPAIGITGAG